MQQQQVIIRQLAVATQQRCGAVQMQRWDLATIVAA